MNRWPTAKEYFSPVSYFMQNFSSIPKRGILNKIVWTRIAALALDAIFCSKDITNTETYGHFINVA